MSVEEVKFRLTSEDNASKTNEKVKSSFSDMQASIASAGVGFAAVGAGLGLVVKDWVDSANEAARTGAQLDAVIKSTGGAAGITADQVKDMASGLAKVTTIGDDTIVAGQNMLLTFTNIGKDAFPRTTETMLDMATAMNGGVTPSAEALKGTAIQLGKALNDPTQGMSALSRVGVAFTDQQKKQIETMQKSGDMMGAQTVILDELAKEFGGSAKAAAATFEGQMLMLNNRFGEIKESLGQALIPILQKFGGYLTQLVGWFEDLSPGTKDLIAQTVLVGATFATVAGAVLLFIAAINPVTIAVAAIMAAFALWKAKGDEIMAFLQGMGINVPGIWAGIVSTIQGAIQGIIGFFGNMVSSIQKFWPTLVDGFNEVMKVILPIWDSLWKGISIIAQSTIDIITGILKLGFIILYSLFTELEPYIRPIWEFLWEGIKILTETAITFLGEIISTGWDLIQNIFLLFSGIFTLDWDKFWTALKEIVSNIINIIGSVLKVAWGVMTAGIRAFIEVTRPIWSELWTTMSRWSKEKLDGISKFVSETWATVTGFFTSFSANVSSAWNSFWDGILKKVQEVVGWIKNAIDNLLKTIGELLSSISNLGSKVGGAISGVFGGGMATGGRVANKKTYLVGEKGPELFTPPGSGNITPNNKLSGGGGSMNFNFYGTVSSKEVALEYAGEVLRTLQFSSPVV